MEEGEAGGEKANDVEKKSTQKLDNSRSIRDEKAGNVERTTHKEISSAGVSSSRELLQSSGESRVSLEVQKMGSFETVICPDCRTELFPAKHNFCFKCGERVEEIISSMLQLREKMGSFETVICPDCKSKLFPAKHKFCFGCSKRVEEIVLQLREKMGSFETVICPDCKSKLSPAKHKFCFGCTKRVEEIVLQLLDGSSSSIPPSSDSSIVEPEPCKVVVVAQHAESVESKDGANISVVGSKASKNFQLSYQRVPGQEGTFNGEGSERGMDRTLHESKTSSAQTVACTNQDLIPTKLLHSQNTEKRLSNMKRSDGTANGGAIDGVQKEKQGTKSLNSVTSKKTLLAQVQGDPLSANDQGALIRDGDSYMKPQRPESYLLGCKNKEKKKQKEKYAVLRYLLNIIIRNS